MIMVVPYGKTVMVGYIITGLKVIFVGEPGVETLG